MENKESRDITIYSSEISDIYADLNKSNSPKDFENIVPFPKILDNKLNNLQNSADITGFAEASFKLNNRFIKPTPLKSINPYKESLESRSNFYKLLFESLKDNISSVIDTFKKEFGSQEKSSLSNLDIRRTLDIIVLPEQSLGNSSVLLSAEDLGQFIANPHSTAKNLIVAKGEDIFLFTKSKDALSLNLSSTMIINEAKNKLKNIYVLDEQDIASILESYGVGVFKLNSCLDGNHEIGNIFQKIEPKLPNYKNRINRSFRDL